MNVQHYGSSNTRIRRLQQQRDQLHDELGLLQREARELHQLIRHQQASLRALNQTLSTGVSLTLIRGGRHDKQAGKPESGNHLTIINARGMIKNVQS
ncbi:MAG: hypothetical protein KDI15_08160 [Thiothrix sp.]|mgnify:CR=1 FL=1|nr:hypothetical protein [Thiothrix sp.]HPE60902.1 hypothetical protein [Thiolinea sp.]